MPGLRAFSDAPMERVIASSRVHPRGRANFNIHRSLDDPIQRMLNVFQPGSYVRPHRHLPDRPELFLRLAGEAAVVLFGETGEPIEWAVMRDGAAWAVEVPGDAWHTVFALRPDTVLFEVKDGPYRPTGDGDFAPWAPREGEAAALGLLRTWEDLVRETPSATRG
jgi:cupin fold WbuC family metalloprotein